MNFVHRLILRIFLYLAVACALANAWGAPAVALYYGSDVPLTEFRAFDVLVVEPDHQPLAVSSHSTADKVYAYVSVGEVQAGRSYFAQIPAPWKLTTNRDWQSVVIDQSAPGWPAFFADQVVAPLWAKGYRGFFLDTLDSYRLAKDFDEQAQQAGLVRVIDLLAQRFPGIHLILNRGFDIVDRVRDKIEMVAAESLYRQWDARNQRYEEVKPESRQWLLDRLHAIRQRDGLPVLVIDYVAPDDRALARATAEKIKADGFIPWVTDSALSTVGIGSIEPMPRHILVLYNGAEAPSIVDSSAHMYLQMPMNYMGYVTDYVDVRDPLPDNIHRDRYAGVVSWFSGFFPDARRQAYRTWLMARLDAGMPVAIIGDYGLELDAQLRRKLGLAATDGPVRGNPGRLSADKPDAMMGLEDQPPPIGLQNALVQLADGAGDQVRPLVAYQDAQGRRYVGGAIMPWGGFVLDPNVISSVPGSDTYRWVVNPFAFLQAALRLPSMPVPDTTTENGRRLLTVHVDGDGFASMAEFPGSPPAAQVLLERVFEKYRIPQTMSVIEAEVAPDGLYPKLSPRLEDIARRIFRLPYMEIGNHSYSHPFVWDPSLSRDDGDASEAALGLKIPGYTMNLDREIVGSTNYINSRLAPPGKKVSLFQWTGDTTPSAKALEISYQEGLLNINGRDTFISRMVPSLTAVSALGIRKNGYLQVYAPVTNENIYTNLWKGPFYGFERAIETFEMTGSPRRIKPVGIYYHTYSASKAASLRALYKVYDWAMAQPLNPVHTTDFVRKVEDFYTYAVAREDDGWRLRGDGHLRTVRLPAALGVPDMATSRHVAGWHDGPDGPYVHLDGGRAWLKTGTDADVLPYLYEANGRLDDWRLDQAGHKLGFTLTAYVPLQFSVAHAQACVLQADGKTLKADAVKDTAAGAVQEYRLKNVNTAHVQIHCAER